MVAEMMSLANDVGNSRYVTFQRFTASIPVWAMSTRNTVVGIRFYQTGRLEVKHLGIRTSIWLRDGLDKRSMEEFK